ARSRRPEGAGRKIPRGGGASERVAGGEFERQEAVRAGDGGDIETTATHRRLFREGDGDGGRREPAREPAGAVAETAGRFFDHCGFFRDRDRTQVAALGGGWHGYCSRNAGRALAGARSSHQVRLLPRRRPGGWQRKNERGARW